MYLHEQHCLTETIPQFLTEEQVKLILKQDFSA
jgi:hypothetical protein